MFTAEYIKTEIDFKQKDIAKISNNIDYGNQLDSMSYSIAEAYQQHKENILNPKILFVSLSRSSNESDFAFVNGRRFSPSKFVYTLPNICAVSFGQSMSWDGPVICQHSKNKVMIQGILESIELCKEKNYESALVVTCEKVASRYNVEFISVRSNTKEQSDQESCSFFIHDNLIDNDKKEKYSQAEDDTAVREWINNGVTSELIVGKGLIFERV